MLYHDSIRNPNLSMVSNYWSNHLKLIMHFDGFQIP